MKEQRISVEINAQGQITVEADGFSGDACLHDLERLLDGLAEWETVDRKGDSGERIVSRTRTTGLGAGRKQ